MLVPFKDKYPKVDESAFIAPNAYVIGDVTIGEQSSVFFGAVLRGDILPIVIGARCNIQENSVFHTSHNSLSIELQDEVTIGHKAIVHSAHVGYRSLIGMGATIMDNAIIGEHSIIAAGAIVTEGKKIPPRSLVVGIPGKIIRTLNDKEIAHLKASADHYVEVSREYMINILR